MYKRIKDETDLLAKMRLPIRGKQYLHVYVWKNNNAMRDNYDYDGDFAAAYCGLTYKVEVDTGEPVVGNKFGEIHFVHNGYGAGIFAHELQHFVMDWIDVYGCEFEEEQIEEICTMVGKMTVKYWVWFYDTFERNTHATVEELQTKVEELRTSLLLVLDDVDYTAKHPGCRVNTMVGAALPKEIIVRARQALEERVHG